MSIYIYLKKKVGIERLSATHTLAHTLPIPFKGMSNPYLLLRYELPHTLKKRYELPKHLQRKPFSPPCPYLHTFSDFPALR